MRRPQTNQINDKKEVRSMFSNLKPNQESPTATVSSAMSTSVQGILGPHPRTDQPWSPGPIYSSSPHQQSIPFSCLVSFNLQNLMKEDLSSIFINLNKHQNFISLKQSE